MMLTRRHADYVDKTYEKLAVKAQNIIKDDPELLPYYFQNGFTFITDGKQGKLNSLWEQMFENVKAQPPSQWEYLDTPEDIFRNLHGKNVQLPSEDALGRSRKWRKGYTSKRCVTVNAEAMVKVYFDRARAIDNVTFLLGTPVDRLLYGPNESEVQGVILEDGRTIRASKTIIAAGAWSSRLVKLDGVLRANAVGIGYMRLSAEEYRQYKDMGCYTNLISGVNIFTPINGLLKILRRSAGIINTTSLRDPEDPSKTYDASYPKTAASDLSQGLPHGLPPPVEHAIRDEIREILPQFADRPFEKTRICWYVSHSTSRTTHLPSYHCWQFA